MTTADLIERALADLPATIRRRRGPLSYRQAANESGVPFNTITRVEKGGEPTVATLIKLLRWAQIGPTARTARGTINGGETSLGGLEGSQE